MTQDNLGKAADKLTRDQFAAEIPKYCRLTTDEVNTLFPDKKDRVELGRMIDIVVNAATDTESATRLVKNIGSVSNAVVKVLRKFVVAV
jgi:hypothetical protein